MRVRAGLLGALLSGVGICADPGVAAGQRARSSSVAAPRLGPPPAGSVIVHANLDEHVEYMDIWGYTAPTGGEYALLTTTHGLAVVNVTDRGAPYETGFASGPFSLWRDVKTYDHYAYVTDESGGGLAIVDLVDPESPVALPAYRGFPSAHNLWIDEPTARCFIAGARSLGRGGVRVLSLADPENPVEIGSWEGTYVHDVFVQGDRLCASAVEDPALFILDIGNLSQIVVLGQIRNYPNAKTHNAWATADGRYLLTTDEVSTGAVRMWDVSNPAAPFQTDFYKPNPNSLPHNVHVKGDLAFVSFYTAGIRVLDISEPFDLEEVGYFDTWPQDDDGMFEGCWGAYPFFPASPNLILASDLASGLWVLEFKGELGGLRGAITARPGARAGGVEVAGARIEVLETGAAVVSDATGRYELFDAPGRVSLEVSAFGHVTRVVSAVLTGGLVTEREIRLDPVPSGSVIGRVTAAATTAPIVGGTMRILGTPLVATTDAAGIYVHPAVPAGDYTVEVRAFGYHPVRTTASVAAGAGASLDFALNAALVAEDFETAPAGWTVQGTSDGRWQRGNPTPTWVGGAPVQPDDDHTPDPGVFAWITGLSGGPVDLDDVDGGPTRLITPPYDVASLTDPHVSFWRWYSTGVGLASVDDWVVEVSPNGGGLQIVLERLGRAEAAWTEIDVPVASIVSPTPVTSFRFTAQDTGAASTTEAGLDDFSIWQLEIVPSPQASARLVPAAGGGPVLSAASPNPFRVPGETKLVLTQPAAGWATAGVFDVAGRRVASLVDGPLAPGPHVLRWDGRVGSGGSAAPGVYFLRVGTAGASASRKLHVLR